MEGLQQAQLGLPQHTCVFWGLGEDDLIPGKENNPNFREELNSSRKHQFNKCACKTEALLWQ